MNFEMFQVMIVYPGSTVSFSFQLWTLWEALSVSPSIGLLVRLSVRVEKWKNKRSRCLCVGVGVGVWMGVGCLCLKQRNTCREWNKPKRCQKKKKRQSTRQNTITKNSKTSHLRIFSYGESRLYWYQKACISTISSQIEYLVIHVSHATYGGVDHVPAYHSKETRNSQSRRIFTIGA